MAMKIQIKEGKRDEMRFRAKNMRYKKMKMKK